MEISDREVLEEVGSEGVGGSLPILFRFSSLFLVFLFVFLRFSLILLVENREFHPEPVCTDPVQNFPISDHCCIATKIRANHLPHTHTYSHTHTYCELALTLRQQRSNKLTEEATAGA